jgi:hypothetical protein
MNDRAMMVNAFAIRKGRGAGTRGDGIGVMLARHAAALREDSPRASGSRLAFTTPTFGAGLPIGEINVLEW